MLKYDTLSIILYAMPVTKTAKRALRSSKRKESNNKVSITKLEVLLRTARKSKKEKDLIAAFSMVDRVAKKKIIHKNKAAHIKSLLSRLLPKRPTAKKSKSPKKR